MASMSGVKVLQPVMSSDNTHSTGVFRARYAIRKSFFTRRLVTCKNLEIERGLISDNLGIWGHQKGF